MSFVNTTSHKPPYIFEQIVELNNKAYVLSGVSLKKKRRVIFVNVGLYKNNRMVKDYVKNTDMRLLSSEILNYSYNIFASTKVIRGVLIDMNDKTKNNMIIFMKRELLKTPELKMRIYAGPLGILLVRKPFSDTDVFGVSFEELYDFDLSVIRKLPSIKKPVEKVIDSQEDESIYDAFEDMDHKEILKKVPYETWMMNSSIARYFHELKTPIEMMKHYRKLENATISLDIESDFDYSIADYTSSNFSIINDMFRGYIDIDISSKLYITKTINNLAKLFKIVKPLPEHFWTLRSLHINDEEEKKRYDKLSEGDYIVDTGFVSTSPRPYREDSDFMRILLPKGSHVLFLEDYTTHSGEFEILLPPGSVFKMVGETILPEGHRVRDFVYIGNVMDDVIDDFMRKIQEVDKEIDVIYESIEPGDLINGLGIFIGKVKYENRGVVVFDAYKGNYAFYHIYSKYKIVPGYKNIQEYVIEWNGDDFSEGDVLVKSNMSDTLVIRKRIGDVYIVSRLDGLNAHSVPKEDLEKHIRMTSDEGVFIVKNSPYGKPIDFEIDLATDRKKVIDAIKEGYPITLYDSVYVKFEDKWFKILIGKKNVIEIEDADNIAFTYDYTRILTNLERVVIIKEKPREVTFKEAMSMPDSNFIIEVVANAFIMAKGQQIKGDGGKRIIHLPMFV